MDIKTNLSTLFSMVRSIFSDDVVMLRRLNESYEASVIKKLTSIPKDYMVKLNKILLVAIALIESIDFTVFSEKVGDVKFEIDSYLIAYNAIIASSNPFEKTYAKNLLEELRTLFACLDQVVSNPSRYARNMSQLKRGKNDFLK